MTDFQPKTTAELEDYMERLALAEGPVTFGLYKAMIRIGNISPPDILEQVRIAQKRMAEAATIVEVPATEWVKPTERILDQLTEGDDERTPSAFPDNRELTDEERESDQRMSAEYAKSPLPIAGNPPSGVEKPIDGRTREGRAARSSQRVG